MNLTKTSRGFEWLEHDNYVVKEDGPSSRLASASSAVGNYHDSLNRPGTSYLWIGDKHHLNREQVREFAARLNAWAETGSLKLDKDPPLERTDP